MLEKRDLHITLGFPGDVMLGRLVNQVIKEKGHAYIWGDVLSLLQEPQLTLGNLECVIAKSGEPFYPPRVFYFRALPDAVKTLTFGGIDYVSLANNHAMDFREPGLLETIQHLDKRGIAHAGAGKNLGEASKPAFVEAKGIKIGVIAFADHYREGWGRAGDVVKLLTKTPYSVNFIPCHDPHDSIYRVSSST